MFRRMSGAPSELRSRVRIGHIEVEVWMCVVCLCVFEKMGPMFLGGERETGPSSECHATYQMGVVSLSAAACGSSRLDSTA